MKCFNCGNETNEYLCPNCCTEEILDKVFEQIRSYKAETCENPYLAEYVATLTEERAERNCLPDIIALFPENVAEYYRCVYNWIRNNDEFESSAIAYLDKHEWVEEKSQRIISYLLKRYIRNDFVKPRVYCDWIAEADGVYCELYVSAAMYYSMIAEYDLSDKMVDKGFACDRFLYSEKAYMQTCLENQRKDTLRYRTKKPYWPNTEERRRAVAMFYDEKGISYPRIETKPRKIAENEFVPTKDCFDEPENYCSFWAAETHSMTGAKAIYQIAAIRVESGEIKETFQSFIRPWDGKVSRQYAAKQAGVPISVIEGAEDVDQVMVKFFDFVGENVLVSTGASGNQAKLLSRAARYTGMKQIKNELFDLLDLAADTDSKFDLANNNREYIMNELSIAEGKDSLEKAEANIKIFEALKNYGK